MLVKEMVIICLWCSYSMIVIDFININISIYILVIYFSDWYKIVDIFWRDVVEMFYFFVELVWFWVVFFYKCGLISVVVFYVSKYLVFFFFIDIIYG